MTVTKNINSIHLDATGQAHTGPGIVKRVILYSGSTAGATVTLYDNTSATGNKIAPTLAVDPSNTGGEAAISKSFEIGAEFSTGVHAVMTGTSPECVIII
jgi:hypothetical protein